MKVERTITVTVVLGEQEARDLAYTISEALFALNLPQADGYPFNWRSDPTVLKSLHNQVKPADWGELA